MSLPASRTDSQVAAIPGFELQGVIGRGGMAEVHRASQLSLDRPVALKVLSALNDPEQRQRFQNESRIIGSLNHRNIVTIHDVGVMNAGTPDEQVYIAMELLGGGDLAQRLHTGAIDSCTALETTAAIADCLALVHDKGIVHRDIKPANILFHDDGRPVLTDFGIASDLNADTRMTAHGATVGSPCYISPEQVLAEPVDGRTDIYSLGIVLYEMLVGRVPFEENSAVETMAARLSVPAPRLPAHLRVCQDLLDRMLARDPEQRFANARELADAVRFVQFDIAETEAPAGKIDWLAEVRRITGRLKTAFSHASQGIAAKAVSIVAKLEMPTDKRGILIGIGLICLLVVSLGKLTWFLQPAEVRDLLGAAQIAVEEDRLFRPRSDSAVYYYRRTLAQDPQNDYAFDGLHEVAELAADRAEWSLDQREFSEAKLNVDRGLNAEPDNERLLALSADTNQLRGIPEKLFKGVKSIFE